MSSWDPELYLRHADDRGRPFLDLLARVDVTPATIVDLGCGPGQLTPVLQSRWPTAWILGVDSSPDMIEAARANADDHVQYVEADVATWEPDGPVDLMVSNALFQWVPDQLDVIRRLAGHVSAGGAFAVQVPNNMAAPSHTLLHEISSAPPYGEHTAGLHEPRGTDPQAYLELFAGLGWDVDVWDTTYRHVLEGDDPVFSWISGTGARPVLQALPDDLRPRFEQEYKAALREAYPQQPWGTVLPFTRVFAVAHRG
ncbi:methyltransferase domain-containing protein [Aeromicrobium sp.]|uniref:methyltransferase domain-containing protein n=1 Tax=Aeromicrobium sp. TaxID=1871063 RepID=UPI003C56BC2D